jgi:hypothetical protein
MVKKVIKSGADGTVPVLGRIRIGKSMVQFSAKVSAPISLWDTQSGRAMSFIDMANLKQNNLKNGYIVYARSKTKQVLTIKIEKCI